KSGFPSTPRLGTLFGLQCSVSGGKRVSGLAASTKSVASRTTSRIANGAAARTPEYRVPSQPDAAWRSTVIAVPSGDDGALSSTNNAPSRVLSTTRYSQLGVPARRISASARTLSSPPGGITVNEYSPRASVSVLPSTVPSATTSTTTPRAGAVSTAV